MKLNNCFFYGAAAGLTRFIEKSFFSDLIGLLFGEALIEQRLPISLANFEGDPMVSCSILLSIVAFITSLP